MKEIKIGDKVKVLGNAEGTAWEYGIVDELTVDGNRAYILYSARYPGDPYGLYGVVPRRSILLENLQKVEK